MSLLTKQQIADILWMSWDHGHFEWKGFKWDLMRWNKKQTAQFEPDWDIQTALEQNGQEDGYAWSTVADYEKEVGFEVNDVFKAAWAMARTRLSNESTAQPAPEPVAWIYQSTGFRGNQMLLIRKKQDMAAELWVESPLYLAPPKREPSITAREMYQRGYAAAERNLKREPLSDEEINAINLPEKQCTLRELVRLIEKAHGIGIVE